MKSPKHETKVDVLCHSVVVLLSFYSLVYKFICNIDAVNVLNYAGTVYLEVIHALAFIIEIWCKREVWRARKLLKAQLRTTSGFLSALPDFQSAS